MTIAEMEPLIDKTIFEKLEVRLKKGHEVHFFICCQKLTNENDDDDEHYGHLIIYDGKGRAWGKINCFWRDEGNFILHEVKTADGLKPTLNGSPLARFPHLDLK